MTKGVIHARREKFIRLMVPVTTAEEMIAVYKECFPRCIKDSSARVACYRLLQDTELVAAIDKLKQEEESARKRARQREIETQARQQVVTEIELDAVLSNIATGKLVRKKKIVVYNPVEKKHQQVTVDIEPDENARIAAADKLYKRKGSYASKKIMHEAGDNFIEVLKALSTRKIQQEANV
jgi:gamma-glutamylcyclotransferase (GGCT)/AIG2-like uncharacterized protein YtfP